MRSAATACTSRSRRMIRSSPCTSTSCWSSGEKSTWSPTFTCRTLEPTPRAPPQTSRLATWAVAGMRMPPVERRSPSSLRSATRMRSCSILIGSLPAVSDTQATLLVTCWSGPLQGPAASVRAVGRRGSLSPAEFVEPGVVDAEVVRDLVDDGDRDLLDHLVLALADVADGLAVDHDPVRQRAAVLPAAVGQRVPLVEAQQVGLVLVAVLDQDDDVVQQRHQLGRDLVEGVGNQLLELREREGLHQLVGSGRPSSYPAALCTPSTARSCSSSTVRAPAYVQEDRTPATMPSMRSSTPGRSGSRYMREELIPSSNSPARARSNPDWDDVRALTARAEAMPNDSL